MPSICHSILLTSPRLWQKMPSQPSQIYMRHTEELLWKQNKFLRIGMFCFNSVHSFEPMGWCRGWLCSTHMTASARPSPLSKQDGWSTQNAGTGQTPPQGLFHKPDCRWPTLASQPHGYSQKAVIFMKWGPKRIAGWCKHCRWPPQLGRHDGWPGLSSRTSSLSY